MSRLNAFFGLAIALLLVVAPASAQTQTRTLTIHNNTVYVDGNPISKDQLPSSLDVSGVEAQYRFLGIRKPVVEINGSLYAVTNTLEPVSEDEVRRQSDASVILQRPQMQSPASGLAQASTAQGRNRTTAEKNVSRRADNMEVARQEYLQEMQRRSQELYEKLMRERRMELESREIARTIRLLPDGPERDAQIDTLRATLNRIFDLKQDNRRREIEQLQRQIDELQRRLEKREDMRDEMIQRRLEELIGEETAANE
ncbi:hypothetical protein CRI94_03885 [Longibacter salinarum]|uniref:PEGA domain-containing protein n=1 Tax=Longibacter salinarum TaxID=1850348 RepID=A0A2A8CZZ1_9BACT|nr:hypothetical protein [Longibacter salinarum]PEN14190.1 hypothetical protein CRI94_03885 [Longibacter salinarum]